MNYRILPIIICTIVALVNVSLVSATETVTRPFPDTKTFTEARNTDVTAKDENFVNAQKIDVLPPAGLDPVTIELFTCAVSDLHKTAKDLSYQLIMIENRVKLLKAENQLLKKENLKIREIAKIKKQTTTDPWQTFPLDKEVQQANMVLENLLANLTGLAPFNEKAVN